MKIRSLLLFAGLFAVACAPAVASNRFEAIRPTHDAYCSIDCQTTISTPSCANWNAPELADAHIGECITSMACANDPAYACDGEPSHVYDWDCYVGCVMMESADVQNVVLANLRCDYPSVCR